MTFRKPQVRNGSEVKTPTAASAADLAALTALVAALNATVSAQTDALATKPDDAPADGSFYVRQDGAWVKLPQ